MADTKATFSGDQMTTVSLILVEEPVTDSSGLEWEGWGSWMGESLWELMPSELVERVLLFLPASSQARFHCVCKRWRQVMTSAAFQEQSASLSFGRGSTCFLRLGEGQGFKKRCKVREVHIPGLVLPPRCIYHPTMFVEAVCPVVAVVCCGSGSHTLGLWLLNLANKTWRELQLRTSCTQWLGMGSSRGDREEWTISVVPMEHSNSDFQVLFSLGFFQVYSCTSTDCHIVATGCQSGFRRGPSRPLRVSKGHAGENVFNSDSGSLHRCNAEGLLLCPLPDPPLRRFNLLTNPNSDAVFGWGNAHPGLGSLYLYMLDESCLNWSGWQWRCVYFGLPDVFHDFHVDARVCPCIVVQAEIVGNRVLILALVNGSYYILAYNMLQGSGKWFYIPAVVGDGFPGNPHTSGRPMFRKWS